MMKKSTFHAALATLAAITSTACLQSVADTVHLKDGSHLIGTIVSKKDDTLVLKTSFAGNLSITWSEVASIETDETARFMLKDKSLFEAQASSGGNESVILKGQNVVTTSPVDLADVAYINPPPEVTGEGLNITGRANVGLTSNRGNTHNDQLFYDAEALIRGLKNRFTIGATGERKKEEGTETARSNRAYFKYDHFISEKWYAYANTDVEEDEFKDLNLRTTLGAGSGYQFFETPRRQLSLEGGLSYVHNDYILAEDDGYGAGRWAVRYSEYLFGTSTQFFHNHEGLASLDTIEDTIIRSQTGVRFPLLTNLSGTIQYDVDWNNNPPAGYKNTDTSYIVSVGYHW